MIIDSIAYSENIGEDNEWILKKCSFDKINLIVAKNSTGKSRTLNIIANLANMFLPQNRFLQFDGEYDVIFNDKGKIINYHYKKNKSVIKSEKLFIDGEEKLIRDENGEGFVFSDELRQKLKFKVNQNELAIAAKRDSIQHPFLDYFFDWSSELRYYQFGTNKDKETLILNTGEIPNDPISVRNRVASLSLKSGIRNYSDNFKNLIIQDMKQIGYEIEDIGTEVIPSVLSVNNLAPINGISQQIEGIFVKEKDLKCRTNQINMSQGMSRALALIIQINYSILANINTCFLIDDIGEGLDYERSKKLILLMIDKLKNSQSQLIMSTNDRFVMNNVPLEYWIVLSRDKDICKAYNYENSKKKFDEFAFTGLNNFDFFTNKLYL